MEQQLQQERIVIENDDEIEIDLKDLVLEILSFWKWVLFALIIGAVTAYCISRFVMVPQYESTSQFYVLSKSMSITSLADIQTGTSLTNDYMVIVEGRPVLEQVIENLGLDETYSSLKKKVTLNNPSNSRILEITVRDANPSMAKKIADEIEQDLQNSMDREISTEIIGERVMEKLRMVDQVAYVRFASVYRQFKDIDTFMAELNKLLSEK